MRPLDTLRPEQGHAFAMQVEVDQREVSAEPVMVLFDAAVFHLVEAEDAFQYGKACSTFALTRDLVVFFVLATSST